MRASIIYSTPQLANVEGPNGFGIWEGSKEGIVILQEEWANRPSLHAEAESIRARHDQDAVLVYQHVKDEAWANAILWTSKRAHILPDFAIDELRGRNGSVAKNSLGEYRAFIIGPMEGPNFFRPMENADQTLIRAFLATRKGLQFLEF